MSPVKVNGAGKGAHTKSVNKALRPDDRSRTVTDLKEKSKKIINSFGTKEGQKLSALLPRLRTDNESFFNNLSEENEQIVLGALETICSALNKAGIKADDSDRCFLILSENSKKGWDTQTKLGLSWRMYDYSVMAYEKSKSSASISLFLSSKDDKERKEDARFSGYMRGENDIKVRLSHPITKLEYIGAKLLYWIGVGDDPDFWEKMKK